MYLITSHIAKSNFIKMMYLNNIQNMSKVFVAIFATIIAISCGSPIGKSMNNNDKNKKDKYDYRYCNFPKKESKKKAKKKAKKKVNYGYKNRSKNIMNIIKKLNPSFDAGYNNAKTIETIIKDNYNYSNNQLVEEIISYFKEDPSKLSNKKNHIDSASNWNKNKKISTVVNKYEEIDNIIDYNDYNDYNDDYDDYDDYGDYDEIIIKKQNFNK